jgi:hypothetical protein
VGLGLKLAQVALSYGADDLHGTIIEEHIFHSAGATSPQLRTEAEMIKAIREAGRTPVQRNTFYEPIRVLENVPAANEAEASSIFPKSIAVTCRCRIGRRTTTVAAGILPAVESRLPARRKNHYAGADRLDFS